MSRKFTRALLEWIAIIIPVLFGLAMLAGIFVLWYEMFTR